MSSLPELLSNQSPDWLRISPIQRSNLLEKLERFLTRAEATEPNQKPRECSDEQLWTFLVASAYASGGKKGTAKLARILGGKRAKSATPIWLDALPMPPRQGEGNTSIDLAFGGVAERCVIGKEQRIGIEYDPQAKHVGFCLMKWYSDIATSVTNDRQRNQLARVIENALTFQADRKLPKRCTVTLVTPAAFQHKPRTRLYQYKYRDYKRSPKKLLKELRNTNASLPIRHDAHWQYPKSIAMRATSLKIRRVSFEDLLDRSPKTDLGAAVREFAREYGAALG